MVKRSGTAVLLAGSVALSGTLLSSEAEARCFMAFVHGWANNFIRPAPGAGGFSDDPINGMSDEAIQEKRNRWYWMPNYSGFPVVPPDPSTSLVWSATNTWPKSFYFVDKFDYPVNKNRSNAPPCVKEDGSPAFFVAGYNGNTAFWNPNGDNTTAPNPVPPGWTEGAAGVVARQLGKYIDDNGIQANELIIVTQSMGGLVTRWMLNNGVSEAAYYSPMYEKVASATRYAITGAAPHLGSPAADALYELNSEDCYVQNGKLAGCVPPVDPKNPVGSTCGPILVEFFTQMQPSTYANGATRYMQTRVLKQASASGGWMQDGARQKPIYTVAGTSWYPWPTYAPSGDGFFDADGEGRLALYWMCLNYVKAGTAYGGVTSNVSGDGLVTRRSAHGMYDDSGATDSCYVPPASGNSKSVTCSVKWSQGSFMASAQGMRRMWLDVTVNHQHARWNDQPRDVIDYFRRNGVGNSFWEGNDYYGDYLAKYGRDLDLHD